MTGYDYSRILENTLEVTSKILKNPNLMEQAIKETFISNKNNLQGYNNYYLAFNTTEFDTYKNQVLNLITRAKKIQQQNNINVEIVCMYENEPNYNTQQVNALIEINNFLKQNYNQQITFPTEAMYTKKKLPMYLENRWNFDQVLSANLTLNKVADTIKACNFTPYERFLAIYSYVNHFVYTREEENEHYSTSRRIIPVLENGKIVCVGYSQLMEVLCSKLDIPCYNLKCTNQEDGINHQLNVVKIVDSKYNINGIYACDCTSDSFKPNHDNPAFKRYVYHLINLNTYFTAENMKPFEHHTSPFVKFRDSNLFTSKMYNLSKQNLTETQLDNEITFSKEELLNTEVNNFLYILQDKKFVNHNFINPKSLLETHNNRIEMFIKNNPENAEEITKEIELDTNNAFNKLINQNRAVLKKLHNEIAFAQPIKTQAFEEALSNVYKNIDIKMFLPDEEINLQEDYLIDDVDEEKLKRYIRKTIKFNEMVCEIESPAYADKTPFNYNNPYTKEVSHEK